VIRPKTSEEIEKIREAGRAVAAALEVIEKAATPGVTTAELDGLAEEEILSRGATPAFKGYRSGGHRKAFPASICASVNDEVVHGIPGNRKLLAGDILSVDVGARWKGFVADAARSFPIGNLNPESQKLLDVCREALERAIARVHVDVRVMDIAGVVEDFVLPHGLSIVRDLVGHGVGKELWEEPQVPNFRSSSFPNPKLPCGTVIAIEPMICAGQSNVGVSKNGWTVQTLDGSLSAHFENTIAVTEVGAVILTAP